MTNATNPTANTITILKTTERGAHLITDGVRVAWIMGRYLRADGSLTPSGLTALEEGELYTAEWRAEFDAKEARRRLWVEDRQKAIELARKEREEEQKRLVSVSIPVDRIRDYSEKAWKVRTLATKRTYGKIVSVYEYLPKSVVSVEFSGATAVITMPKWYLDKNYWLNNIKVTA